MITDNIEKISSLLKFKEGIFYYIQVIQRRKDNPDLVKSDMKRYQTFITSEEDFKIHLPRIKKVCADYNARAYISLLPRSLEKLAKECALEYVKRIAKEEYKRVWDIPNRLALSDSIRAAGVYSSPWWLFDMDDLSKYDDFLKNIKKNSISVIAELDTVSGKHIIVRPFNPKRIEKYKSKEDYIFPDGSKATLRKDCNTILYASIDEILITE